MRYIAACTTLLLLTGIALGSPIVSVQDKETQRPIDHVELICKTSGAYATTNAAGRADLSAFTADGEISFNRIGYATVVKTFAELEAESYLVRLQPVAINFNEVVVSATRWRQSSNNTPAKVTSISPDELALESPQTAADLLAVSGQVFVQKSQQGGGSPMIRGFATNRLLYTVDGVRMNTAIFRGGNIQNVISLDPFAVDHTEVLFGPASVMYGSDAIGGVMSFQTLAPQFSISDEVRVEGKAATRYSAANNERTGHFDINVGGEQWASRTSISSFDFDNLRQGSHGPTDYIKSYYVQRQDGIDVVITQQDTLLQIPSAYSQTNLMQKLCFKPAPDWELLYAIHYSETSPYGRYDRHNRVRNGTARYAEWSYGPQKWMMNQLRVEHHGANSIYDQLTLQLALQNFEESRIDRSLNESSRSIRIEEVDAYSVNLDLVKSTGPQNTLFYGVEFVSDEVTSTGIDEDISDGSTAPGPARYPQATWKSMAAYLSDQYELSDRLTLLAGLRYNRYSLDADFDTTFYPFPFTTAEMENGALTGSVGALYRPAPDWVLRINAATAFRSPNVDDMGKVFDSEPGSVVVPNPDLKAEYAYCVDFGAAKVFGDLARIDLTAYYTSLEEALVRGDFTLNGRDSIMYDGTLSQVQAIQNAATAEVYGMQAGVEIKFPAGLGFSTDINYQYGEEELDEGTTSPSRHAAPFFGISRLRYDRDKTKLELYAVYQAERKPEGLPESEKGKDEIYAVDADGNTYAPSWYTLNFKARRVLTEVFSIAAGVENLTDQRYRPYSSGISGAGRNFFLSLTASF